MKHKLFLLILGGGLCISSPAKSATFTVSTSAELQSALTTAQSNGEDDSITLNTGTYTTTGTAFTYNATAGENYSITLNGNESNNVVLDGDHNNSVINFDLSNVLSKTKADVILQNLTFQNANGNGLYILQASNVTISHGIFSGNTGAVSGGALYGSIFNGTVLVTDSLFTSNSALQGSVIYFLNTQGIINLINNTFTNNSSPAPFLSPPVYLVSNQDTAVTNFYNNIAYNNHVGLDLYVSDDGDSSGTGSIVNLYNNLYEAFSTYCLDHTGSCTPNVTQNANLPGENPLFISDSNFQLEYNSPCIDTGLLSAPSLPDTDLIGNPRSIQNSVDMGAYQSIPTLATSASISDFGNVTVNSSSSSILTFSNSGNHSLSISEISLSNNSFSLDVNAGSSPCTSTTPNIPAGNNCTAALIFSPTSEGSQTATVTVTSDDPNNASSTLNFTGTGISDSGGGGDEGSGSNSSTGCALSFNVQNSFSEIILIFSGMITMISLRRKKFSLFSKEQK